MIVLSKGCASMRPPCPGKDYNGTNRPRCLTYGKNGHLSKDCPPREEKPQSKDQPSVKSKDTERDSDSDSDSLPSGSAKFPGSAGVAVATPSEGMY